LRLLKSLSAARFAVCMCRCSSGWLFVINLVGGLVLFSVNRFFATGIACFAILRIAALGLF
jgi:hypothetical protein